MNTKGLLYAAILLFGFQAVAAQEKTITLEDLDRLYQQAEKASLGWPWSVRTTVEVGDTPKGPWEDFSRSTYTVVPPDRARLHYHNGQKAESLRIGPMSYSRAKDGTWSVSDDPFNGSLISPHDVRRFGDGVISYTRSRSGDIVVVTVISKPSADADALDPRTRRYVSYFADGGVLTGDESVIHNGEKWVRTTNIYTFNPNIRIQSPDEEMAARPIPPPVSKEAATDLDGPLRILSKPRPGYTEDARANSVQGSVILRVTFEADGTIGEIEVAKGLERGLTEATIEAARKMTFTPARKNGIPVPVTRQIEYRFSVY